MEMSLHHPYAQIKWQVPSNQLQTYIIVVCNL